jgi:hypothetical protein
MFSLIEDFYEPNELGLVVLNFINLYFKPIYHSKQEFYQDRLQSYPCYETDWCNDDDYLKKVFIKTFEKKTNIKILHCLTFLRKTKLNEFKKSASWGRLSPHVDTDIWDLAGLIYMNSNSIKDGTLFYNNKQDYEPTAVIGSKLNRCVYYSSMQPHSPSNKQHVEERWIQPFFIITKEQTYENYKNTRQV